MKGNWSTRKFANSAPPTRTHLCKLCPIQLEIQIDKKSLFMDGFC